MDRKEKEAVCLFIHMIRKIWDGYYKDANKGRNLSYMNSSEVFFGKGLEKPGKRGRGDVFIKNAYPTYASKRVFLGEGPSRTAHPFWHKQGGNLYEWPQNAPRSATNIDYQDNVLFRKFKIKTNSCAGSKLKSARRKS